MHGSAASQLLLDALLLPHVAALYCCTGVRKYQYVYATAMSATWKQHAYAMLLHLVASLLCTEALLMPAASFAGWGFTR
jgi:hypothetical protein